MGFWNRVRRFFVGFGRATLAIGLANGVLAAGSMILTKGLSLFSPLVSFGTSFFSTLFSSDGIVAGLCGGFNDALVRDEPVRRAFSNHQAAESMTVTWNAREGAHGVILCESNVVPAPIYYTRHQLDSVFSDQQIQLAGADWYRDFCGRVPNVKEALSADNFFLASPSVFGAPGGESVSLPPNTQRDSVALTQRGSWEDLVHSSITFDPNKYVSTLGGKNPKSEHA